MMNNPVRKVIAHSLGRFIDYKQIISMENLYKNIQWICVFLLMGFSISSFAQRTEVSEPVIYTGVVIDANHKGIEGVTVSVQESNVSTLTDNSGRFSISTSGNNVLIFKKSGYLSKTHSLALNASIEISLEKAKILWRQLIL